MIETGIMRGLLKVLHLVGKPGLRFEVLQDEVGLTCAARPSGEQIREHIRHAEDQALIVCRAGLIGEKRYFITEKGEQAYREACQ